MELTILIPALNEEKTIQICVKKALKFLEDNNINGEVLVIDNNSTDQTAKKAIEAGGRVEKVEEKGYGIALIEGTKLCRSKYVIMGDADDSYNFLELKEFVNRLREGYDIVIGNRFKGKMEKGAMKFLHKYIGTPIISHLAQRRYNIKVSDFNCGLRGYDRQKVMDLKCISTGMEYATEMLIKAQKNNLKIIEIPINFYKDKRERPSHLKTIRDGIRHMKIILKN